PVLPVLDNHMSAPQNLRRLQAMADNVNDIFLQLIDIDGINVQHISENSARIDANLKALQDTPIVANAGLLKAGKSSLFNAISGQQEKFATGAARCTTVQQALAMNGFQLVDTPGLDANDTDTAEAESVFQKASL